MSGLPADDVSPVMESFDALLAPQRCAKLRAAFHRLIDVDLARRQKKLWRIEAENPAVAPDLRGLLAQLEKTDLLADPLRALSSRLGPVAMCADSWTNRR